MKRTFLLLGLMGLLSPLACVAGDGYYCAGNEYHYDECNSCCDDTCFFVGAEYLYMQPCIHDPYFLVQEGEVSNEPRGKRYMNDLDWNSGFRVFGGYNLPCDSMQLWIEGLYFDDTNKRKIFVSEGESPPLSLGTKGHPLADLNSVQEARSKIDYCLWSIKGGAAYKFSLCGGTEVVAKLGLHYADLQLEEDLFYDEINNLVFNRAKMDTWAIGPELGVDIKYAFGCMPSLSFVARASYGLLIGQADSFTKTVDVFPPTPENGGGKVEDKVFARNEENCIVVPVPEFKLGFNYEYCCGCFKGHFEIGYDVLRYTDFLDRIRWIGDAAEPRSGETGAEGLSLDHYSPFMLHGLYLRLALGF